MSENSPTGVGTTIPPVQLPGGKTITGNSLGGGKKMPAVKSEKPKPKYTSVMTIPSWKTASAAETPPPPKPEGPTFDITTRVPGLEGKKIGTEFDMSIKVTLKGIREDDRGIRYEIEVNSVAV